jgi:HlyD family secretion protein
MSTTPVDKNQKLNAIVAEKQGSRWIKRAAIAGVVVVIVVVGLSMRGSGSKAGAVTFATETATRSNLVVTVQATGNLAPTNEVEVGSEVSGLVDVVYVDDNDHVKKGQVLARLDTSKLQDQVVNARAAMTSSQAKVLQAGATVKESEANLTRLRQVFQLSGGKVPSKAEMETAEATATRAKADEASAKAAVEQAQASLSSAEINLRKATIFSPIDGVVLSREVEPGQTVQASFSAPTLFTLAENLTQMELQVDVDESDVGSVREGQPATFTVNAYTTRKYPANVTRVGYGSQTKDNVVSYKTLLTVNNDDLSLRPGMTATAEITIVKRENALLVPNAALRFEPPAVDANQNRSVVSRIMPGPPRGMFQQRRATTSKNGEQKVWVLENGVPVQVPVTVGATDGRHTEITGGGLKVGMAVITETTGGQQ